MRTVKSTLPEKSLLFDNRDQYHFTDSFQSSLKDSRSKFTSADLGKAFFSGGPKWIGHLFTLRNKIVGFFGLKTAGEMQNRQEQLDNFKCEKGERLGLFQVFDLTENELILGEDDKHLDFRVSLFLSEFIEGELSRDLTITTTVVFHNRWGRLYFIPVRPFHKIIVPSMLRQTIRALEKRNLS